MNADLTILTAGIGNVLLLLTPEEVWPRTS